MNLNELGSLKRTCCNCGQFWNTDDSIDSTEQGIVIWVMFQQSLNDFKPMQITLEGIETEINELLL